LASHPLFRLEPRLTSLLLEAVVPISDTVGLKYIVKNHKSQLEYFRGKNTFTSKFVKVTEDRVEFSLSLPASDSIFPPLDINIRTLFANVHFPIIIQLCCMVLINW